MKVAIVYDRVNKWGGAERVLLTLHEMFPDAPLFTSVYDMSGAPWAKVFPEVITSYLQKIPFARTNHEYFAPLMPSVFEKHNFDNYDLVISVTSEFAKGIITGPTTKHICYCLTPTRYLWSHQSEYISNKKIQRILKPVISYLKKWDKIAARRPDVMIAISTEVRDRIKKYYGRDAKIIFPPTNSIQISKKTRSFGPRKGVASRSFFRNSKGYYLVVSRMVKYKRVDLAVEVFSKLGLPLYVVGIGRELKKYKSKYKFKNVKFLGFVPEKKLLKYYQGAKALIMPQEEDFGLVAVEAQMHGVPLIAFKKGGTIDIIKKGTGVLFKEQTVKSLTNAIKKFDTMKFDSKEIKKNAERFSKERFKKEFMEAIK